MKKPRLERAYTVQLSPSLTATITARGAIDLMRGDRRFHLTPPEARTLTAALQHAQEPHDERPAA
jgi:hypothetical protein